MFGKGCAGRERSELPWITGINDWSKMKGSCGKDKAGKLETHFSSEVHAAALRVVTSCAKTNMWISYLPKHNAKV